MLESRVHAPVHRVRCQLHGTPSVRIEFQPVDAGTDSPAWPGAVGRVCAMSCTTHEHPPFVVCIAAAHQCIERLRQAGYRLENVPPASLVDHFVATPHTVSQPTGPEIAERIGPLWTTLKPFQREGVSFCVRKRRVLLADGMGCGKTIQAVAVAKFYEEKWPVLVVCPSILRTTWKREFTQWLGLGALDVHVVQTARGIAPLPPHKVLVVSYALLGRPAVRTILTRLGYKVVILDESHYIKTRGSQRTSASLSVIHKADVRLLISGTPFAYPSELYTQIKALYPKVYPWFFNEHTGKPKASQHFFASRYCAPEKVYTQREPRWVYKGYDNCEELSAFLSSFTVRRRKEDVLTSLPRKTRSAVVLAPLSDTEYTEISSLLENKTGSSREDFMASFRLTCTYKIPHVIHFIEQRVVHGILRDDSRARVLVFSHHTHMREAVESCLHRLGVPFFSLHGATSHKKRAEYEHHFQQTDRYRVGVLSIQAACTGLTLTRASTVVFTELMFGPDVMFQAEDRVHRIGQTEPVQAWYLIAPRTTDDINWGLVQRKDRQSSSIIDRHATSTRVPTKRVVPQECTTSQTQGACQRVRLVRSRGDQ